MINRKNILRRRFCKQALMPFLIIIASLLPHMGRACICWGERNAVINRKNCDVACVCVLTQIVRSDSLFTTRTGTFIVQPYYNFKVLRYCKGLAPSSDFVSIFPDIGSSCAGGLKRVTIGDTILLFASLLGEYSTQFLAVDQCTPFAILTNRDLEIPYLKPNESELRLMNDTTIWHYPAFNNLKPIKKEKKEARIDWKGLALIISLTFNFFFLIRTIRRRK